MAFLWQIYTLVFCFYLMIWIYCWDLMSCSNRGHKNTYEPNSTICVPGENCCPGYYRAGRPPPLLRPQTLVLPAKRWNTTFAWQPETCPSGQTGCCVCLAPDQEPVSSDWHLHGHRARWSFLCSHVNTKHECVNASGLDYTKRVGGEAMKQ